MIDWSGSNVERVAHIITILNPCGYDKDQMVRLMKTYADRLASELMRDGETGSYIATLGWCITIYTKREGGFGAKCTVEAFTIEAAAKDALAVFGVP